MRRHVAIFSQTGSEINEVSKQLDRYPDLVICNNFNVDQVNKELIQNTNIVYINKNNRELFSNLLRKDDLVTLHGYLRILPKETCECFEIYNGHPGDIVKYPFLKGKDPQVKAFSLSLPTSGAVIHKVTPTVDDGEVVLRKEIDIIGMNVEEVIYNLHKLSVKLWVEFFSKYF